MLIETYQYREFWGVPQYWEVQTFSLGRTNLLVGKNSSGKTRVVNTIGSLARIISVGSLQGWISGDWSVTMRANGKPFVLEVTIENSVITRESVKIDGEIKLERHSTGQGRIWYEELNRFISFEVTSTTIAIVARRDKLQHSFLEPLFDWAAALRQYQFSTDLGRFVIAAMVPPGSNPENADVPPVPQAVTDQNAVVDQYRRGFESFNKPFDEAILRDLEAVGYPCSSVSVEYASNLPIIGGSLPIMLQVQEKELGSPTRQLEMSTGMFRALAIIIHVNFAVFNKADMTLIIDDIGEGLDFSRSKALIDVLLDRCQDTGIQLLLTSNDRFVMNEVDLQHWHVLERSGHVVSVRDNQNSEHEFKRFKMLGLSNFDFFSMEAFRGAVH